MLKRREALTDYRVVPVNILGSRGGLNPVWQIHTGRYHRVVAEFTSQREALDELARLVNEVAEAAGSRQEPKA